MYAGGCKKKKNFNTFEPKVVSSSSFYEIKNLKCILRNSVNFSTKKLTVPGATCTKLPSDGFS